MILVDSCKVNYKSLLMICLKLKIKIAKLACKEKMLNQNLNLLDLKMIDWIKDAKNAREHLLSQEMN